MSKFALLNGLGGEELSKALLSPDAVDRDKRELINHIGADMRWLTLKEIRGQQSLERASWPFRANYGVFLRRDMVRFCPACLRLGFHSLIFQAWGVSHCPHHLLPLETQCTTCGADMPALEEVCKTTFVPLHCPHCRSPWCDFSDFEGLFGVRDEMQPMLKTFAELTSRLEECFRLDVLNVSLEQSPVTRKRHGGPALSVVWALHFSTDVPKFLEPVPALCWGPTFNPVKDFPRSGQRQPDDYRGPARLFRVASADSRGIDAIAPDALASTSGHTQRHTPTLGYVLWDGGEKFVMTVRPSQCACCATLVHWRATESGLMAAIKQLPHLGQSLSRSMTRPLEEGLSGHEYLPAARKAIAFRRSPVRQAIALVWGVTEGKALLVAYQQIDLTEALERIDHVVTSLLGEDDDVLRGESMRGLFTVDVDGMVLDRWIRGTAGIAPADRQGHRAVPPGQRSVWFIETGSIESRRPQLDGWLPGIEVEERSQRERKGRAKSAAAPLITIAPALATSPISTLKVSVWNGLL